MNASPSLKALLAEANAAAAAERAARRQLASALREALSRVLRDGMVIDLSRRRGAPEYLLSVKTVKGADRGTRKFRLVGQLGIEVDPPHITSAKWTFDAVPISEKTGKDMSGATHGADSRDTVRLRGDVFAFWDVDLSLDDDARIDRLFEAIQAQTQVEAR